MAYSYNDPFGRPFGGAKSQGNDRSKRIATGNLASPVAFSRSNRDLNRTKKMRDKQMGSRGMR